MGEWVVRAEEARSDHVVKGYREHLGALGTYGFSVPYDPGSSVGDLALAAGFSNGQMSYQDEGDVQAACRRRSRYRGTSWTSSRRQGVSYHHTCSVTDDASQAWCCMRSLPMPYRRSAARFCGRIGLSLPVTLFFVRYSRAFCVVVIRAAVTGE
jgi:hypothetical protein